MTERTTRENRDLAGEDLTKGPTPETRHPEGGGDDLTDTTEGPTPEIRAADRAEEIDEEGRAHASGQPDADSETRSEHTGDQV